MAVIRNYPGWFKITHAAGEAVLAPRTTPGPDRPRPTRLAGKTAKPAMVQKFLTFGVAPFTRTHRGFLGARLGL
ncbi:MAG: hypothetical protein LBJ61_11515 [Deltaproteobacteria bacterium]|nr:hypothetical protein [Deltaproteobacteria bacterium]